MSEIDEADELRQKGIQSVEQASVLLEALIDAGAEMPLTALAKSADMSPSSAHRYLTSLVRIGLVRQSMTTGHYDLGSMAIRLGLAALSRFDFIEMADQALHGLTQRVGFDGHVTVWGDYGPTIIRIRQTNSPILTNLRLGRTVSVLGSASGRVFCAFLPSDVTRKLTDQELRGVSRPFPDRKSAEERIAEVRANGFAWIDGSVIPGLRSIAAPVRDLQGNLLAVIALVGAAQSLVDFPNPVLDDLLATAERTSRSLGFSPER
jgi:DNA-binding IclR family transcriptional regulator